MLSKLGFKIEPAVFYPASGIILALVFTIIVFPEASGSFLSSMQSWLTDHVGWFYILTVTGFLAFVVWLGFSKYGSVKLGKDDDEPEFGYLGWFAMLFSAGMGIGLLYNGVGEPLTHYTSPPIAEPRTPEAADDAMRFTYYHWGLHPWSIYALMGLSVGYFSYRRDMPLSLRSAFYPIFGERIYGPIGHAIDTFGVVGTMFGVAASLSLGAMQISAGLGRVFDLSPSLFLQMIVIAVVTATAIWSVVTGLSGGIQRLSQANLILTGSLLVFLFVTGSTIFMLDSFVQDTGYYLEILAQTALWTDPNNQASDWFASWTLGYWGWWLAWAPFVGIFVARVSRGRTIREFVLSVLVVPTVVSYFWFSIAGAMAIEMLRNGAESLATVLGQENGLDVIFFEYLTYFPFTQVTSLVVIVAVFIFFVTSSDSGSLVIDMITAGGRTDPPKVQRIFWAITEGLVAAVLLLAGGLEAVRSAVAAAGLPVAILMICMAWGLLRALSQERKGILAERMRQADDYVDDHGYGTPERKPKPAI